MRNLKISITIPVYDTDPKLLEECFNSVLNQTHQNYECFIVNDGSKKYSTLQFINQYVKNHEKFYLINSIGKNKGPGNARNLGVRQSTGDIVMYMDSDDYMLDKAFERVNEIFNQWPKLDILSFENRVLLVSGNFKNTMIYTFNTNQPICLNTWNAAMLDKPSVWAKAYRRDFLVKNNLYFPEEDVYMEDLHYLLITYSRAKQIMFKPEVYYILRETSNSRSLSQFNLHKAQGLLNAVKGAYDIIKNDHSYISDNFDQFFGVYFFQKLKEHKPSAELQANPEYKKVIQTANNFTQYLIDLKSKRERAKKAN